jgi:DinB family protein
MESMTESVKVFRVSADRFADALADVPDATWVFKPSPSVWSMAEVIEHVTMTDQGVQSLASQALRPFEAGEQPALDDAAFATIFDGDAQPPPDVQEPSGTWTDRAAALAEFGDASDSLAVWYETCDVDLRRLTFAHPIFGLLDGVQWLLFAAAHHDNHTRDVMDLRRLAKAATG